MRYFTGRHRFYAGVHRHARTTYTHVLDDRPPGQGLDARGRPAPPGLRDSETGQERAALAGHTDTVLLVAFRADRVLLTVGREGFARVWRAAK
jgi:hypothetical protein